MMDWVPETQVSGFRCAVEEMGNNLIRQVGRGFSSFFAKFLLFLNEFSKCNSMPKELRNFEKSLYIVKSWQKK